MITSVDPAGHALSPVLSALASNARQIAATLASGKSAPPSEVPLAALRAAIDEARESDQPRELDLALLCRERISVTLDEVRSALSK